MRTLRPSRTRLRQKYTRFSGTRTAPHRGTRRQPCRPSPLEEMMRRLILSGLLALGAALAPGAALAQSPSPQQKQNDTSKAKDDYVQSVQARLTQVDAR